MVDRLLADGRHCLLHMEGVDFLDSTGVGLLIRSHKALAARGRRLVLVSPSVQVRRALGLMKLNTFFQIAPDEQAGQSLLKNNREPSGTAHAETAETLVRWHDEVTAANAEDVWQQTLPALTQRPGCHWLIDLSELRFIDSTGLGLMVRARKLAQQRGVGLVFTNPQPAVLNVVRISGLESLLF